jgi:HD-like signal output (HDOD) protein
MKAFDKYLNALPVMPDIAAKIVSIPEDNINISFKDLEELIKVDPGLTTKILKVANSAMYARQTEITSSDSNYHARLQNNKEPRIPRFSFEHV